MFDVVLGETERAGEKMQGSKKISLADFSSCGCNLMAFPRVLETGEVLAEDGVNKQ
ncbi:hypothetical protein [Marinobacter lipolyticus]|uniref:hypothetical protein n=1 Tax=Marinobacter lipolyticus TaxID=209639 RepID=UPI001BD0B903|nr:hypothetical protein [Marinobacter lipolyticus]